MGLGVTLVGPGAHAQDGTGRTADSAAADMGATRRAAGADGVSIVWKRCKKPLSKKLQCGTLSVPLDHADPFGRKITIALTRKKHTVPESEYKGILLVNPGGPGGGGRELATVFEKTPAAKAAAAYDVIGFDPRGVGASKPRLQCSPAIDKVLPDAVPANARQERFWLNLAKRTARTCEKRFGWMLPHMRTEDSARDMDYIRAALGQEQLSFLGYSWGTNLGMTYATLFPERVNRMVLDSVVNPSQTNYEGMFDQNIAVQRRIRHLFAWLAKRNSYWKLGTTAKKVEATYYRLRAKLKKKPTDDIFGPTELDQVLALAAYSDEYWTGIGNGLSFLKKTGDGTVLALLYALLAGGEPSEVNDVYLATLCTDTPWPREWSTWRRDTRASYQVAPLVAWTNTWGNAACAFWPVEGSQPLEITGEGLPPILMVQATYDPATPYAGALEAHRLFPSSRLILEKNGGNHGVSLSGNKCIDRHVADYLATGTVPPDQPGPDATCAATPAPNPRLQT
ncbi:alpha/beta hydrolase [Thermopolyspora sp. NPDC052614]|uniref:alpha/beta hydrolase n=1 Tax=Thermopolyspora sp. NPDC052614 TaxID=3155682 RepID=UPI00344A4F98